MSTKLQSTVQEKKAQSQEEPKPSQKEEAIEAVWENLPEVLRKQLALQLAKLLYQVVSQPLKREVCNE